MKYIGKYGEQRVLASMLAAGIETYPAIRDNQTDYDLTAILSPQRVVRLQVKTTELRNSSTNNAIDIGRVDFDFLVIVVVDDSTRFFVLTRDEVLEVKKTRKRLSVTRVENGEPSVREEISIHEDRWDKFERTT